MAKKKGSNGRHDTQSVKQGEAVTLHQETPSLLVDSQTISSLKSLNVLLMQEAVEHREKLDSLLQSKESLEMDVSRSNSEREVLDRELALLVERAEELEVEKSVLAVFASDQGKEFDREIKSLEMQMKDWERVSEEKESEIARLNVTLIEIEGALGDERETSRRVRVERNDFEDKLNRQIMEDEGLKSNLAELDVLMKDIQQQMSVLQTSNDNYVREKKDLEEKITLLMEEKDSMEKGLTELKDSIEGMKAEISCIEREKEEIENEKNEEIVKRSDLENLVSGLKVIVSELEEKCFGGDEKMKQMEKQIDELLEEMELREKDIQAFVHKKNLVDKELGDALKQLAEQRRDIENLNNDKIAMAEAKRRVDAEVGELHHHVAELKATVSRLEELNRADMEKIMRLESEVRESRSSLERVSTEKNGVERLLNEEQQNGLKLKEKIEELEKEMEESIRAAGMVKADNAAILIEKAGLVIDCEKQREEIASLQSRVDEADGNSKIVLKMLKQTSDFCSKEDQVDGQNLHVNGEELKAHVMEMEAIKQAFKSKAARVEEMEKQLEGLENSVADAEKRKSFWAMLSSATTVLAAISVAYAARGH